MFNKVFENVKKKRGGYFRSPIRHRADACPGARERRADLLQAGRRASGMKVYFCGSIRGGRDDVELYLRIVTKLKSFATVLTEHVSQRDLGDAGQNTPGP